MNDKELWELMSIICEGQDSEQRRKVEQYITDLQQEIEILNNIINELEKYCIEEIEDYSKEIKSQYITDNTRRQYEGEKVCFEDILGRLQELKGDGSNGR